MDKETGVNLVRAAIQSGIDNDLGSGRCAHTCTRAGTHSGLHSADHPACMECRLAKCANSRASKHPRLHTGSFSAHTHARTHAGVNGADHPAHGAQIILGGRCMGQA